MIPIPSKSDKQVRVLREITEELEIKFQTLTNAVNKRLIYADKLDELLKKELSIFSPSEIIIMARSEKDQGMMPGYWGNKKFFKSNLEDYLDKEKTDINKKIILEKIDLISDAVFLLLHDQIYDHLKHREHRGEDASAFLERLGYPFNSSK